MLAWLLAGTSLLCACEQRTADEKAGPSRAYAGLLRTLYRNTVPLVSATELAQQLSAPTAPLLLDVRTPAEFRVSHVKGARFVNADSLATARLVGVDRNQPVVVYCSVGYRSERLGERLHALGFRQVHNVYGGIFEWVNEGRPVYNARGLTQDIHPYSALWSPWLERGRQVYE
jgi:rhodanese-related sulfurtransferase